MKRLVSLVLAFCLISILTACGNQAAQSPAASPTAAEAPSASPQSETAQTASAEPTATASAEPEPTMTPEPAPTEAAVKTLVVYFSATGNTKAVAEKIAALTGADVYELLPAEPYTEADLDYNVKDCRANLEMNDSSARPAISGESIDLSGYDTVIVGYPIWWGTMPRIINTFLDAYDLSGKTVLPFCTSGGSGVSRSVSDIRDAEPDADVRDGLRARGADDSGIESWLSENGLQ